MLTRSVVVPVYRNEATLPELLRQLSELYERSSDAFEMVFVVDGSPDNSYAVLKLHLSQMPFPSQLISLSRNFGSFAAIRAGMTVSEVPIVFRERREGQSKMSTWITLEAIWKVPLLRLRG